jgi:hypothetical protein
MSGRRKGPGAIAYMVGESVRLAIGAGLALAAAESGQVATPVSALAVGVSAPMLVERLLRSVPLTQSQEDDAYPVVDAGAGRERLLDKVSSRGLVE